MLLYAMTVAGALTGLRVRATVMEATPITASPRWPTISSLLDALPVFALANGEGKPLQYEVNGKPMAIFYADVLVAKTEYEGARDQLEDPECDMVPVSLGVAYKLASEGKATIVPGMKELTAAGMPAGLPALGQELPLFACMQMTKETDDGGSVLPVFMSVEDCESAVKQARETNDDPYLEIAGLSLPGVIEHLASMDEGKPPPFEFIPPSSSTTHLSSYVGKGVYARVVDKEDEEVEDKVQE